MFQDADLRKETFLTMHQQFENTLTKLLKTGKRNGIVKELLTKTEKVMLAKRVFILLMLLRGYSFRQIEMTLKVTIQTIGRMHGALKAGKFKNLTTVLRGPRWRRVEPGLANLFGLLRPRVGSERFGWERVEE